MVADDTRKRFGAYLARLRRDANMSQRQLAEELNKLGGVSSLTRNDISRWERGARVPDTWLPFLAQALHVPIGDLQRAADYARGNTFPNAPISPAEELSSLLPPVELHLPNATRAGRRVGMSMVAALSGRVHALRLADDVISGKDLVAPAFRELRSAVSLYGDSTHTEEVGRALLGQVGEMAQIAGWIASDAGQLNEAEHAYQLGISAAREANDSALVGNLAGSLAYQLSNNGHAREAVTLARAALDETGKSAHPTARALSLDRLAWAYAQAGQAQPAIQALDQAHEALSTQASSSMPSWAYWVSEEELRVMDARVFTELRRPLRAVPLLKDNLAQYDSTHTREMALYSTWLVIALADANEPEEAAAVAARMLDLGQDLASERTAERARVALARLEPFRDVAEVRELMANVDLGRTIN